MFSFQIYRIKNLIKQKSEKIFRGSKIKTIENDESQIIHKWPNEFFALYRAMTAILA